MAEYGESDSDSDGGVPICDIQDYNKVSETTADVQITAFTFKFLLFNTPFPADLLLICAKEKAHPPHDHVSPANSLAFDASRHYVLPENALCEASEDEDSSASITDITGSLLRATLSNRAVTQPQHHHNASSGDGFCELTPREIRRAMRKWTYNNSAFVRHCIMKEATNRFPGIDMNSRWNRARCRIGIKLREGRGTAEEIKAIEEGYQRFSFTRQTEPLVLPMSWDKMFALVFVGNGYEKSVWSREPGSWWATRKGVFNGGHGSYLLAKLREVVEGIEKKVDAWREDGSDLRKSKRKWWEPAAKTESTAESLHVGKKRQVAREKSEEVMNEAWRMRRRMQEKKAGRWTDGTLRMDRLWDGFYWVLDTQEHT